MRFGVFQMDEWQGNNDSIDIDSGEKVTLNVPQNLTHILTNNYYYYRPSV